LGICHLDRLVVAHGALSLHTSFRMFRIS
jgi:hypothetical protein